MTLSFNIYDVLLISSICFGVHTCTRDDMIFGNARAKFQTFLDKKFGVGISTAICAPLFECVYCQSSFWSIILFWLFGINFIHLPLLILAVCGINTILSVVLKHLEL